MKEILRRCAGEGCVLLKNESVLPFEKGTKIALFGRIQLNYYKCSTGSGGSVNIEKQPDLIESLENCRELILDSELLSVYKKWAEENPYDNANGNWIQPYSQKEMPLSDDVVKKAALKNDAAVIIIGRNAGEGYDCAPCEGSYYITKTEEEMIKSVCENFEKVALLLNVGGIIDLGFAEKYNIGSIMYIWQGGEMGADAVCDVLSGKISPSGKLCDTQARRLEDYPFYNYIGDDKKITYNEDIFVGYRYFESFARDKVMYPFGFGLGYTEFEKSYSASLKDDKIEVCAEFKNIGKFDGREVLEVYFCSPNAPKRQLCAFKKTKNLASGESQRLCLEFSVDSLCIYDEINSCYILPRGEYEIFAGTDVRSAPSVLKFSLEEKCTKQTKRAMAPCEAFERMEISQNGELVFKTAPHTSVPPEIKRPREIEYTGSRNIGLSDVYNGKNTLDEFIAQFSDSELSYLVCGEGMNSPKAEPGTGGAIGGLCEELLKYEIPVCTVTDGPSGLRFECGKNANLVPIGTLLASTWDPELVEEIYTEIGKEAKENSVDTLLGPGVNIHRNVLCGRNFEYYSEDPLLAGKMAAAVTRGVAKSNCYCTIKHFCANNREKTRTSYDAVISERALREIYLKPFEIAVKEGKNVSVMTAYNKVNGYYTASCYDLTTSILREEWGFDGLVMSDWWAFSNLKQNAEPENDRIDAMVRAQNDVFMVCKDAKQKSRSVIEGLKSGYISRGELQRNVRNILKWILNTNTFKEFLQRGCKPKFPVKLECEGFKTIFEIENPEQNKKYSLNTKKGEDVQIIFSVVCNGDELSQNPVNLYGNYMSISYLIPFTFGIADEKEFVVRADGDVLEFELEADSSCEIKKIQFKMK